MFEEDVNTPDLDLIRAEELASSLFTGEPTKENRDTLALIFYLIRMESVSTEGKLNKLYTLSKLLNDLEKPPL